MKSILLRLFLILLLSIPVYLYRDYFLQLEVFPGRQSQMRPRPSDKDDPYLNLLSDRLTDFELNEIFWKRRVKTKIPDTYTLVFSLLDSSVWLDINGTSVHESKILSFKLSPDLIAKRNSPEIKTWIQKSFFLSEEWATVPKEPIRTKDISGDRTNVDSLDFRPFVTDSTDIMVVFMYSENLKIGLKQSRLQSENNTLLVKQIRKQEVSDTQYLQADIQMSYTNLLQGDWVSIELDSTDVIAIYRALILKSELIPGL